MATNQYLTFGTAGGANVLSPSDYAGLAARLSGFTAGTAASIQLNTVWRQSSVISAMVGEFVGDYGGFDALDDGNVENLERDFVRTLQKQPWVYSDGGGTANAITITLAPAPASLSVGMAVCFKPASTNTTRSPTLNVNGLGAKTIVYSDGTGVQDGELVAGRIAEVIYDGTNFVMMNPWTAILRLSPRGARQTSAFTPGTAFTDVAYNVESVVQTIAVSGTTYLDCVAYVAFRNQDAALGNVVGYLKLRQGATVIATSDYLGCVNNNSLQTPITIRERFANLNPTLAYAVDLVVVKQTNVGPINIADPRVLALHE